MITKTTYDKFTLFTKLSIAIFSIICTYFCGALMLAFNLRQVGKMKQAWYMIIGSMIFYGVLLTIMKSFHLGSLIEYIVTNTILGLLMAFPVWDYLIPDVAGFKTKSVLIPIISSCVLWGSLLIISQIFIKK